MKILYVDDRADQFNMARRAAGAAGHDLLTAENAGDGYTLASEIHPDLIFIDINLPDFDGLELTRRLRNQGMTIPIVAVTGDSRITREKAILAGCDEFIEKPIPIGILIALMSRFLQVH